MEDIKRERDEIDDDKMMDRIKEIHIEEFMAVVESAIHDLSSTKDEEFLEGLRLLSKDIYITAWKDCSGAWKVHNRYFKKK